MSLGQRVASDHQLARLLQIGIVLEEVVEARAYYHYHSLSVDEQEKLDEEIEELLEHAVEESAEHRALLEGLIEELDADSVPFEEIETLVSKQYGQTKPEDFDGILYDQLNGEETAYKFYDDLILAIEESDTVFGVDRSQLLDTLRTIREEEAEGAKEVADIMGGRS